MALLEISQAQGRIPVTIFKLQERVHLGNFAELENTAKEAYNNGTRHLVIDMAQTDTLTSIGLRALVVIHKTLAKDGNPKPIKISGATAIIREIMQVTGISQFIDIFDTVEEAIASF